MKAVIINADDFGLSPGVNRGIVDGFHNGILTSTTLLANMPAFGDAVALAKANPDLPVGMHMSLLWGPPVSRPASVPSLVDARGDFLRSAGRLAARAAVGGLALQHIITEFRNQIRKAVDAGLSPTHVDTHKHIHALPVVLQALLSVIAEFDIRCMRLPLENCAALRGGPSRPGYRKSAAKRDLIRLLCRHGGKTLARAGIRTTDHFVGIKHTAHLDVEALSYILRNLPDGVTEIMCHPGYFDDELRVYAGAPPHREIELAALKDGAVRGEIAGRNIRLMHYGELAQAEHP